ncbi:mucin-3A [Zerene cesonia]|uniref:mucin-3A n=1 Tax=Zerene cesonia TaxID=33412 RepID=UPI0018E532C7|nr:mucin-3A [Zerene cesonia]
MDQRRAAAALLALAACFACSTAAPTSNNQTALDLYDAPVEGCYYNFQHYSEGDRIMTNEPCLNCTCHNRMLMCYLRVCPFTKPIGQDCTVEKRADQCCPIVTCPDVPVDLLTSTSTSSPAEYGATGLGKLDRYGCSINGKYFPEGSKVPPTPNKPCEHCYCIHNMTTCVMQECTLHVDGCTPIYHKDVCCPIRYSCDHSEDEIPLLDDMTTTVRPTPGFLLTTTTMVPVTQPTQDCVHDDQIFPDGALIKTEKACEHCYCMKGDIVCVVQECGTPMENEGKNCTSLPPRQGQCCPDTYICEGDETQTTAPNEEITTLSPPRRVGVEGSGYRNEPDEPYTEVPSIESEIEGSGEDQPIATVEGSELLTSKFTPEPTTEYIYQYSTEPDKGLNTVPDGVVEQGIKEDTLVPLATEQPEGSTIIYDKITSSPEYTTVKEPVTKIQDEITYSVETTTSGELAKSTIAEETTKLNMAATSDNMTPFDEGFILATKLPEKSDSTDSNFEEEYTTIKPSDIEEPSFENTHEQTTSKNILSHDYSTITTEKSSETGTTLINIQENEISEDLTPGRIPGEGDCLLNSITYKNNSIVPSTSKCHSSCKCVSSIVKCEPIICTPPLEYMENMNDCHPIYDSPESCCPTYVCNTKETVAPESHSQMSGTESPKPTIECAGDECRIVQESKPIEGHEDKVDCGETGCLETSVTQKDLEGCIDGKCVYNSPQHPITETKPCDSDSGCQAPVIKPCDTDNCETKLESPIHDGNEVKPIDTIQPNNEEEILCKEENCRRKEHGDVGQETPCAGNDCLQKEIVSQTIGSEVTTPKIEADKSVTKTDAYETEHPKDGTIAESESTTKSEPSEAGEIYAESTTTAGLYTEKLQTTSSHVTEQNNEGPYQGEMDTPSVPISDITTERFETAVSKEDEQTTVTLLSDDHKINTPSLENDHIDEHNAVVTESYETEKQTTVKETENESELSTVSEEFKITTTKAETDISEITKEITTESFGPESTKNDVTTLTPNRETEILDHSQITQTSDVVTPSSFLDDKTTIEVMFEERTSTNAPKILTTISDETYTQNENIVTDKETVHDDHTDKSHDGPFHYVTERIETTTMTYPETDSVSRVTFSDTTSHDIPAQNIGDKETTQVLESSTISIEILEEDEKHEHSNIPEDSTSITDNTIESSTPAHGNKDTENEDEYEKITSAHEPFVTLSPKDKDFENQQEHETITTAQLPEQFTQEEINTTPSIQDDINQFSDSQKTQEEEIKTTPSIQDDINQYSECKGS